jgi:hypothetical protein
VSAELVVSERTVGDRIISTYNNQLADNRYLKLSYQNPQTQTQQPASAKPGFTVKNTASSAGPAPAADPVPTSDEPAYTEDTDMIPIDDLDKPAHHPDSHRYDDEREAAAASRDRRDRESRRDDEHDRERDRNGSRREGDRERRYDDRGYDRRYDDRPRYEARGSYGGRGDGRGGGYGGGVRGMYARAAGMAGSAGGRGGYRGGYR